MFNRIRGLCLALLMFVGLVSLTFASAWPQLGKRLETWDGAKEVRLPTGTDPIEDPVFAPLVEMLLRKGFAIHTDSGSTSAEGLILERRRTANGEKLMLTRARDGALLALDPVFSVSEGAQTGIIEEPDAPSRTLQDEPPHQTHVLSASAANDHHMPVQNLRIESSATAKTLGVYTETVAKSGAEILVEIPGQPRSIAVWPTATGTNADFHLFALYDKQLVHFCYHSRHLERVAEFTPAAQISRALRLGCVDLDGDSMPELAPVWVEDIHSVDEGTESRLHSWVVEVNPDGSMQGSSADLEGYLAVVNGNLHLQLRGEYRPFAPAVYAVIYENSQYRRSRTPVVETERWVLDHVRWPDNSRILIWNDDERLVLAAYSDKEETDTHAHVDPEISSEIYVTGTLLSDFGSYNGAIIYIPLAKPEYRSGFSAHDRIMERKEHVPRRMVPHGDSLFTLARGRDAGLPLVGHASGRDKLVQIVSLPTGLQARFPFAPVDAFILDFALLRHTDRPTQAVLLLNEKQDGSGRAYVQLQGVL